MIDFNCKFLTELAQKLVYFDPSHFSLFALLALDETFLFAFEIQDFSVSLFLFGELQ